MASGEERNLTALQNSLRAQLDIEALGNGEYRGKNLVSVGRGIFGGQLMGQALMAAVKCVSDIDCSFLLISYHCYFHGPVLTTLDVKYEVNHVKQENRFCSLSVKAVQSDKVCFNCIVCFQKPQNVKIADLDYCNYSMPVVSVPRGMSEILESDIFIENPFVIAYKFPYYCYYSGDEVKALSNEPTEPKFTMWMKGKGAYGKSDHQNYHRIILAYASDIQLAPTTLFIDPKFNLGLIASLDHSMWFHQPVDSERWYLFDGGSDHVLNGISLCSSRIFSEDGIVVATCMQQALLKPKL